MKSHRFAFLAPILVGLALAGTATAEEDAVAAAKSALFEVLGDYEPGGLFSDELADRIDAAAANLEQAAGGPPDLRAAVDQLAGQWINLFSSQGIVGEIDVSFMTRNLPGGGHSGGKARSQAVIQELRPATNFYRNTLIMAAGPAQVPLMHMATATFDISDEAPNLMEVRFHQVDFVPGRADVTLAQVRESLGLSSETPLAVEVPVDLSQPAPTSAVTYLDDDLRINRGTKSDYVAILRKLR